MTDVLKAIDSMVEKFCNTFGDLHKKEMSQHEKHLTWITTKYAELKGLEPSTEEQKPYFSQRYNNFTFIIGYRAGKKEAEAKYKEGYEDALADIKSRLEGSFDD